MGECSLFDLWALTVPAVRKPVTQLLTHVAILVLVEVITIYIRWLL